MNSLATTISNIDQSLSACLRNSKLPKLNPKLLPSFLACATLCTNNAEANIKIAWSPNPENNITKYYLYLSTPNQADRVIDVGNTTSYNFTGLEPGVTYEIAVSAVNADGLASLLSEKVTIFTKPNATNEYLAWAKSHGLTGSYLDMAAVPNGSNNTNLINFACNIAPGKIEQLGETGKQGLPSVSLQVTGPKKSFVFQYLIRNGVVAKPEVTYDLVNYQPLTETYTYKPIDSNFMLVSVEIPLTKPNVFARVQYSIAQSPNDQYLTWAAVEGLSAAESEPSAINPSTGKSNLLTFAFTGPNPKNITFGARLAGEPSCRVVQNEAGEGLEVRFFRRIGLDSYTLETSSDLKNFAEVQTVSEKVSKLDDRWEQVTATIPMTTPQCFVRVKVELPSTNNEVTFASYASTNYNSWTWNAGLEGQRALPNSTPHNDGVANLLKYAFNMDPSRPDNHQLVAGTGISGLPKFGFVIIDGKSYFQAQYVQSKIRGLQYQPQYSEDLVSYKNMTGTTEISEIDNYWQRVTTRMPIDLESKPKLFGRVQVTSDSTN